MDVDAEQLGPGNPHFTKLTDEEKAALMARGVCFRCC